jgi:hypothetical protein
MVTATAVSLPSNRANDAQPEHEADRGHDGEAADDDEPGFEVVQRRPLLTASLDRGRQLAQRDLIEVGV